MQTTATPAIDPSTGNQDVRDLLSGRVFSLIDASLTFKHAHWNVRGPGFIAAHELLDRVTDDLRAMADDVAELLATRGGTPNGLATAVASESSIPTYQLMNATVAQHFSALSAVLGELAAAHRSVIRIVEGGDPVTESVLSDQLRRIEFDEWLIRSHTELPEASE